jgi:hypothetical protein
MARPGKKMTAKATDTLAGYDRLLADVARVIEDARHAAARSVNAVMTATYWLVGRRVVEEEQAGEARARYGEVLVERLSEDLTSRFGRGFGRRNLFQMRAFYLPYREILQTPSARSAATPGPGKVQTLSAQFGDVTSTLASRLPLPWSHYVRLLAVRNEHARAFYETEALRGGWTVRQLDRQIQSQFYERTALSRNGAAGGEDDHRRDRAHAPDHRAAARPPAGRWIRGWTQAHASQRRAKALINMGDVAAGAGRATHRPGFEARAGDGPARPARPQVRRDRRGEGRPRRQ